MRIFKKNFLLLLADRLKADMVLTSKALCRAPEIFVETDFFAAGGEEKPSFQYCVCEAPCRDVFRNNFLYISRGVAENYPTDRALQKYGLQAYLGMTLGPEYDCDHIAFLWRNEEPHNELGGDFRFFEEEFLRQFLAEGSL